MPEYKKAAQELASTKMRLRRLMKARMRAEWGAKQAVEDIENQIQGNDFTEPPEDTWMPRLMSLPLQRLVTALISPLSCQDLAA